MTSPAVLECVRVIHEGGACIVVEHSNLRIRFDPGRSEKHADLVVHTGAGSREPMVPSVVPGATLDSLAYSPPPRRRGRGDRSALAVQLTLPGGQRLVHIGLALHKGTSESWMRDALERFAGADWLLVGIASGEAEAVLERVHRFGADQVMMMDLGGGRRWRRSQRTAGIAPIVDRARASGVAAMVMVPQVSVRFILK